MLVVKSMPKTAAASRTIDRTWFVYSMNLLKLKLLWEKTQKLPSICRGFVSLLCRVTCHPIYVAGGGEGAHDLGATASAGHRAGS